MKHFVSRQSVSFSNSVDISRLKRRHCWWWTHELAAFHVSSLLQARRIFGPKRDEVIREWRKLHNEELNDIYCSPNIVRVIKSKRVRWVGYVTRMGERRGLYRVLVGKPEGKRPLGRPRPRWKIILR